MPLSAFLWGWIFWNASFTLLDFTGTVASLRVEFMNKFFKGDGHKFEPLSFNHYLETALEG
jgi:vacuolar-type H+-ATPase subunit I/STV1